MYFSYICSWIRYNQCLLRLANISICKAFLLMNLFAFFISEIQRGNLKRAIELFDKAIPLANTELEMAHLFGLRDAAMAQITVSTRLNISLPSLGHMD